MIRILNCADVSEDEIFDRSVPTADVSDIVTGIIDEVRKNGDAALIAYAARFDRAELTALEVTPEEIDAAVAEVGADFMAVMERAAENIRAFHSRQVREGFSFTGENGVKLGQRVLPIAKAGLYVPGGTAAYPSTVLMNAIPAKLAGVGEIIIASPPTGGSVNAAILAAARVAGVDRIFKMGGAQAIAAMAYGTESVPRVDKIVGPGNAFVAEAKRQVFGQVAIDMIAGPSEILVIADGASDARQVAADLLSQAEHDRNASAVLVTDSMELAVAVQAELERQLALLPRCEIARPSIDNNGKIIVTQSIDEALDIANRLAPEHLELCVDDPFALLERVENAGSVFLGRSCPEALGDYFAGPNHTLPTSGTARFSSALSVDDFVKKTQFIYYTDEALRAVADDVMWFAEREGLSAHARSILVRVSEEEAQP